MLRALILIFSLLFFIAHGLLPAVASETGESIKATPSRIVLGSLPYGAKENTIINRDITITGFPKNTTITEIDLSHATRVHVINRKYNAGAVTLRFAIDVKQFAENQPYGKFVKKVMRFVTSSEYEPQLVVAVIGWLGTNETPRDFNTFVFNGTQRWQGPWATPNIAGAMLSAFALFTLGLAGWIAGTNLSRWVRFSLAGILILLC